MSANPRLLVIINKPGELRNEKTNDEKVQNMDASDILIAGSPRFKKPNKEDLLKRAIANQTL